MNEVIVNCCHVEIRIEEVEGALLLLRRQVLRPVKDEVQAMLKLTKKERLDKLCTEAWEGRLNTATKGDRGSSTGGTNAASTDDTANQRRRLSDGDGGDGGCA